MPEESNVWSMPPPEDIRPHHCDDVAHQPHYEKCAIQPDEYMRANLTAEELRGAYRYNLNKYLARYRDKGGVEDLRKAMVYLHWLIELEVKNG